MKKSGKLACHVNSNIAIGSLPMLQISVIMVALFEKIYYELLLLPSSQISERMYIVHCTIPFQISVQCENCAAARHNAVICKQLLNANYLNRVLWVVLEPLQDGACTDFFENLSENIYSLKGDLSNATTFNPPLFSLVETFKFPSFFF